MENRDLISVVVPTRYRDQLLQEALSSVFAATRDDFDLEVIVVDDGPSAETRHVASSFPVTYVEAGGLGPAGARNVGIAQAHGTMITFLDDDDAWTKDGLVQLVTALRACPHYGAALGRFMLADANLRPGAGPYPERPLRSGQMFDQLIGFIPHLSTLLVRAQVARAVGPLNKALYGGEDWDWMLRIARRYPICFVDVVTSHLRGNGQIRDYTASTEEGVALRRFHDVMIVFKANTKGLQGRRWLRAQRAGLAYRGGFAHDFLAYSRRYAARGDMCAATKCRRLALQASPLHTAVIVVRRFRERTG